MNQTSLLIGAAIVVGMSVVILIIAMLTRDLATHAKYAALAPNHIWVEFAPKVGKGFDAIVKLDDQKTGAFTYKGRHYFAGEERWQRDYPPGRGSLAQVTFHKCLADPASSDMLTNFTGKPTVDALIVGAVMEQKDTAEAMQRSREESGGGPEVNKKWMWMYIGLCIIGLIAVVGAVFTIKGTMVNDEILAALQRIAAAFPGATQ